MNVFEIRDLSFEYPGKTALRNISLTVKEGEILLLCGRTGCGKTTLLRQLKSCLAPGGRAEGEVLFFGKRLCDVPERDQAAQIGFVLQDVENQIVTDTVWHELAFGLESLGCDTASIRRRVAETAAFFGIQELFRKKTSELSGGQKQLLNLASVMVMRPEVLILDEPTAQLDPIAARSFFDVLRRINDEVGTTIIFTEHRTEDALSVCSRAAVMDAGRMIGEGAPSEIGRYLCGAGIAACAMRVYDAADGSGAYPVTVRDGRSWLDEYAKGHDMLDVSYPERGEQRELAAELKDVWFGYSKDAPEVLRGIDLKIYHGELLAVIGGNGTGKSTMLSLLAGINRPYRGKVHCEGAVMLPQDPRLLFTRKTVREELEEQGRGADKVARLCGLTELMEVHPYDLSGGERQRAAIAKLLMGNPRLLLLDEPTKGMDAGFKTELAAILKGLTARGTAVVMVSHDIEFCAEYADRCAMMFDGAIVSEGEPRSFFTDSGYYTTAARRMSRGIIENAVTTEDIVYACTGKRTEPTAINIDRAEYEGVPPKKSGLKNYLFGSVEKCPIVRKPAAKAAAAATLLIAALTVLFGVYYLKDRKYMFISLLVIVETMIPLIVSFEKRSPQTRELVTIAVMCAIAVAGRCALWFLPHFKPMAAVVIITGASLGAEAGFLTGAVGMFVSNFFLGQGVLTPWQMFSMGMIGFLGGVIFAKRAPRLPLTIFGAAAVLLIYGGIMNMASVIVNQPDPTSEMFMLSYAAGLVPDIIHAVSTAVFLWFGSQIMIEKIERVRRKYES